MNFSLPEFYLNCAEFFWRKAKETKDKEEKLRFSEAVKHFDLAYEDSLNKGIYYEQIEEN